MSEDNSIASLRARVTSLVEQEGVLLSRAFELSRAGDHGGVDALFARVQAMQVERNSLTRQIGSALGTQRMHTASEVWKPGVYDYRPAVGSENVRVRVVKGSIGLQVFMPGRERAVSVETLHGTFDGPVAADDDAAPRPAPGPPPGAAGQRRNNKKNPA
jgi:hypothetical protein